MPLPKNWISIRHGEVDLGWPPLFLLISILVLTWFFCFFFLRNLAPERRRTLRDLFHNGFVHGITSCALFSLYSVLSAPFIKLQLAEELAAVIGIIVFLHWTYFAIKLGRLGIFVALFFGNRRVAFPLLFVNIATLVLAVGVIAVLATEIFAVQVVPLLATSAVFSIVLGIALQDTLGNLFAGLALQMDKPYEIDHWVEIWNGGQKWVGKVYEISWRATALLGFTDEVISIPNRVVAQSTILNFTTSDKPFSRNVSIRVPYDVDFELVKRLLVESAADAEGVLLSPAPFCALAEVTESWAHMRLFYHIRDYANQLSICDRVHGRVMKALAAHGIPIAAPRISVVGRHE